MPPKKCYKKSSKSKNRTAVAEKKKAANVVTFEDGWLASIAFYLGTVQVANHMLARYLLSILSLHRSVLL